MNSKLFILIVILLNINSLTAQEEFPLWENGIPGQIVSSEVEEYASGGNQPDDVLRIHQVVAPSLKAYPAPKEKSNGAAVLICPGGGYKILAIDHEGYQIAEWLNGLGISAFVLKYRLPDDRIMTDKSVGPLQDAQKALRTIRKNAKKWGINPNQIGVMGFSAGGHLAASLSTHYDAKVYEHEDEVSARPDFSMLVYPVISFQENITHGGSRNNLLGESASQKEVDYFSNELQVDKNTPPALLIHSIDDLAVPVENSFEYFKQLKAFSVAAEMHAFADGGHGYGLGRTGTHSIWSKNAENWLNSILNK